LIYTINTLKGGEKMKVKLFKMNSTYYIPLFKEVRELFEIGDSIEMVVQDNKITILKEGAENDSNNTED